MNSNKADVPTPSPASSPETLVSQQAQQVQSLEVTPQWQIKNFMALKDKIIHTNQLIQRYQEKARDCDTSRKQLREAQGKLAALEQGMVGLRAELHQLHEENGRVMKQLLAAQQALEHTSNQRAVQELLAKQLTVEIQQLRFKKEDTTDYDALRKERNGYKDEKDRALKQYRQLKREFEAYKRAHPLSDTKPRVRRRRDSTASSVSCSSMTTLVSPIYQPVLINSVVQSGVNSPASTIATIQSDTSPTLTPPSGKALPNGIVGSEHLDLEQSDPAWTSDASAVVPLVAAFLPPGGSPASTSLPHSDHTSLPLAEPLGEMDSATATTTPPKLHLKSGIEATSNASTVPAPASPHPPLVARGAWAGDTLSCSETSSEGSDVDDMLADLLNGSPPLAGTAQEKEGVAKAATLNIPHLETYAPGDEVLISLVLQTPHPSARDVVCSDPALGGRLEQPCASMPVLLQHSSPAKGRRRHRSSRHGRKQHNQVGKSHDNLNSRSKQDGSYDDSIPELENELQIEPTSSVGGKQDVSFDGREAVLDQSTPALASSAPPTATVSLPAPTGECVSCEQESVEVCMASQPGGEDSSLVDLSDAMAQMECGSENMPCVSTDESRVQLNDVREAVDHTAQQPLAPPPDPTPPQITVELSHTPDHVAAEADTASSEDSDSDISISEVERSLSPLPLSPHAHLQTLSPLPPSPQTRPRTDTISPLPPSPFYSHSWNVSTPISPLPPSPHNPTLSPLPRTPFHSPLQPHHKTETLVTRSTPPTLPLLHFIASVPPGLHTPKPCCAPSPGLSPSKPKAGGRQLRLSESSPFSPPGASSRRGSAPLVFLAESGEQQTLVATAVDTLSELMEQEPSEEGEIVDSEDGADPKETPTEVPPNPLPVDGGSTAGKAQAGSLSSFVAGPVVELEEEGEIVDSEDEGDASLSELQPKEVPTEVPLPADGGSTGGKAQAGSLSSFVAGPVVELEDKEEEGETTTPLPRLQSLTNSPLFARDRCRRPSRKSSKRRRHKSLGSALDSGYMTSFDRLLQSVSKQPSQTPPPTMPPTRPPYGFSLPNPLEATSPDLLPGYQLRSRKVELWEYLPHKRKRSSSGELKLPEEPRKAQKLSGQCNSPERSSSTAIGRARNGARAADSGGVPGGGRMGTESQGGAAAILRESFMYQLRSRKMEGPPGLSRKRKLSVETKSPGTHLPPEKTQKSAVCPSHASNSRTEPQSMGADSRPDSRTEPQSMGADCRPDSRTEPQSMGADSRPDSNSRTEPQSVGINPSPSGGLSSVGLQPAQSYFSATPIPEFHAVGVGPSPASGAGGSEVQPVSATVERRQSSRLQSEETSQRQSSAAHRASRPLNSDVSRPSLDAGASVAPPPRREVTRRTDGATGQEENPTPLSSPKTADPTPLSSPKTADPTPLSSPKTADPTPLSSPKTADPTPLSSPKTADPTPLSSPKTADPTPLGSPKTADPTPLSSPKTADPTPLGSPKTVDPTPLGSPKTADPTPLGSPKTADPTPLGAPKTADPTPLSSPKTADPTPLGSPKTADPTPLSSPKTADPTPLGSPKTADPTPLGSPRNADSNSTECEGLNGAGYSGGRGPDLHTLISRLPSPVHQPTAVLQGSSQYAPPPSLQQPQLSVAQQQLTVCMQCPLPLPGWLVAAMTKTQSLCQQTPTAVTPALKKRKRGSSKDPIRRQPGQNSMDYALLNLERMVCGHLYLSPVIAMFSSSRNVPCPCEFSQAIVKFLRERYYPRSDQVVALYHELCSSVREKRQLDPLDPSFPPPLLKPECQLVALLAHLCRTNGSMTHLLPELTKSLYQAILAPGLKFHATAAMCRILTAVCRLQGEAERVQFLCCDLLRKPLMPNELPLLIGVASIWPLPLARTPRVRLVERNQLIIPGLEQQAVSYTVEVITVSMLKARGEKSQENMLKNFHTLCNWSQSLHPKMLTHLTKVLVGILRDSEQVFIDSQPQDQFPWRRPRPSIVAFRVVHCLRMLAWFLGWVWTNDTLIRAHVWPILQQWHGKKGEAVRESTVICIIRLIGFISQQGLSVDPQSSSILQLQRVLLALLKGQGTRKVTLPLQLAAADSLLELCPPGHPCAKEALAAITGWLKGVARHPAGHALTQEFHTRLLPYGILGSK